MSTRAVPAIALMLALGVLATAAPAIAATPRVTVYALRLDPVDRAARDYARPGYGGGVDVSWPLQGTEGLLSVLGGIEASSLLSNVKTFHDQLTGLRIEQHTNQFYARMFAGGELGPHGNGFMQPYSNIAVGLVIYGISTDVVIPDDVNRQNSINQNLSSRTEAAFGWSAGAGVNLNFGRWGIDGGVRFLKQYGVPQQLGDGAVTIQPAYAQYRLGASLTLPR